jgi:hypothetical protein
MSINLQQRLDSVIENVHNDLLKKQIVIPSYEKGKILVGDVIIIQNGSFKDIYKHDEIVYAGVSLNKVAIALANRLAIKPFISAKYDQLYRQDQMYGVYLQETLFFNSKYKQAIEKRHFDRADIYFARWQHAKEKTMITKRHVLSLIAE